MTLTIPSDMAVPWSNRQGLVGYKLYERGNEKIGVSNWRKETGINTEGGSGVKQWQECLERLYGIKLVTIFRNPPIVHISMCISILV